MVVSQQANREISVTAPSWGIGTKEQQVPVRTRIYKINRLPAGFRSYDEAL